MGAKYSLVAGAAGLIGSFLCEQLLQAGEQVIGLDNFLSGSGANIETLSAYPGFSFIEHDLLEPLDYAGPLTHIYHLACPASPDDFDRYPLEILFVNASGTRHLLDLARAKSAKLLFTSTSEVYGDPDVHPQAETYFGHVNPIGQRSCYDEGKRFAESLIVNYHRKFQVPFTIARVFNTYGPRMRADDGRAIPNFMMQALRGEPLTLHGDGQQTRSFCYVEDLALGLHQLMLSPATQGEVYNLGNPDEYTIQELAEAIRGVSGTQAPLQSIDSPRQDDPARRKPDISKIRQAIGWQPSTPLEAGLRKTWEYFVAHSGNKSV